MKYFLIAFEGEGYPIVHLGRKLKESGHSVFIFNVDHFTVTHGGGEMYRFYESQGFGPLDYTNLESLYSAISKIPEDVIWDNVGDDYLRNFESKYLPRVTLNALVTRDPLLSTTYHNRDIYYHPVNKAIFYKYLELILRQVEELIRQHNPDVYFTIGQQYFHKNLLFEIAQTLKRPFLALQFLRIGSTTSIVENMCIGMPAIHRKEMERLKRLQDRCLEAQAYVNIESRAVERIESHRSELVKAGRL